MSDLMLKRKEAFLLKTTQLSRFTKSAIEQHYGVTSDEFDKLVAEGFLKEVEKLICAKCYRPTRPDNEEGCLYCEHEEIVPLKGYYEYN